MLTATAGGMYYAKTCNRKRPRKVQNEKAVSDTSGADTQYIQELKDPGRSGLSDMIFMSDKQQRVLI